jgi:2-phospho-L-lactate guanylyltransferase (CobY/MobA/RfbA family)
MNSDEAADLAEAMLKDIIQSISEHHLLKTCKKFLVYAPGNEQGENQMTLILDTMGLKAIPTATAEIPSDENTSWYLLPMASSVESIQKSLLSSDLGFKLATALIQIRNWYLDSNKTVRDSLSKSYQDNTGPIMFLGMDSPDLPCDELAEAMLISKEQNKAYLNPAFDGGYSALILPENVTQNVFEGIRWSCSLTAISQLKALSDYGIDTIIGSMINDVDEICDVETLSKRLCRFYTKENAYTHLNKNDDNLDILLMKSRRIIESVDSGENSSNLESFPCANTFQTLLGLNLIHQVKKDGTNMYYYQTDSRSPTSIDAAKL